MFFAKCELETERWHIAFRSKHVRESYNISKAVQFILHSKGIMVMFDENFFRHRYPPRFDACTSKIATRSRKQLSLMNVSLVNGNFVSLDSHFHIMLKKMFPMVYWVNGHDLHERHDELRPPNIEQIIWTSTSYLSFNNERLLQNKSFILYTRRNACYRAFQFRRVLFR